MSISGVLLITRKVNIKFTIPYSRVTTFAAIKWFVVWGIMDISPKLLPRITNMWTAMKMALRITWTTEVLPLPAPGCVFIHWSL